MLEKQERIDCMCIGEIEMGKIAEQLDQLLSVFVDIDTKTISLIM